jgi:hypothetical protein
MTTRIRDAPSGGTLGAGALDDRAGPVEGDNGPVSSPSFHPNDGAGIRPAPVCDGHDSMRDCGCESVPSCDSIVSQVEG